MSRLRWANLPVTAREIEAVRQAFGPGPEASDLTVLSAGDTGVGRAQAGEGVIGLPYALFVAGNRNTLLTLWPVDDSATAEFMRRFFARLKAGKAQPAALSGARQEFRQHPRWYAPFFWAAFVL